ncbi:hypothetical protein CAEBREN_23985 [Caenorhabditis brenneri]|uniref:Uncharacterized protein n=1 Tax=Caenorhabditis brenneri TaxID=135651 RepID=G0PDV3_CAEBE|nr:hypothetical protein CAEBREN_23985 [Caenorhabditis brenneri]
MKVKELRKLAFERRTSNHWILNCEKEEYKKRYKLQRDVLKQMRKEKKEAKKNKKEELPQDLMATITKQSSHQFIYHLRNSANFPPQMPVIIFKPTIFCFSESEVLHKISNIAKNACVPKF